MIRSWIPMLHQYMLEWAIHASVGSDGHAERDHTHVATVFVVALYSFVRVPRPRTTTSGNTI
jgi:hypothetical protein